jgi:hypothetical protein
MLKQGQVVAERRPSTAVYVVTTACGEVVRQPVDSMEMEDGHSVSVVLGQYALMRKLRSTETLRGIWRLYEPERDLL